MRSCRNGKYVRLDDEYLFADGTSTNDSEKLSYLINVDGGVALKSVLTGSYLCNPRLYVICGSDEVKCVPGWDDYYKDGLNPAGLFTMEYNHSGGWSFRARNGKYMCADNDYERIKATSYDKGPCETFIREVVGPNLQDQINAVSLGGTVHLQEGVYRGTAAIDKPVNIIGIQVEHLRWPMAKAQYSQSANNPSVDVGLYQIAIRGGSSEYGGGINNFGRLTLETILITGNTASNSGGGIFNHGSTVCTTAVISNNSANLGAGIFNGVGSKLVLDAIEITYNTAERRGGGVLNKGNMVFKVAQYGLTLPMRYRMTRQTPLWAFNLLATLQPAVNGNGTAINNLGAH